MHKYGRNLKDWPGHSAIVNHCLGIFHDSLSKQLGCFRVIYVGSPKQQKSYLPFVCLCSFFFLKGNRPGDVSIV